MFSAFPLLSEEGLGVVAGEARFTFSSTNHP